MKNLQDHLRRHVARRGWRWNLSAQVSITCVTALVLALGATAHVLYFISPPEYFVITHGDIESARSVSFVAIPLLFLLSWFPATHFRKGFGFLSGRYQFARLIRRT